MPRENDDACGRRRYLKIAEIALWNGAPGRTRTSTMLPPTDLESAASTNSATGATWARRRIIAAHPRGSTSAQLALRLTLGQPQPRGETATMGYDLAQFAEECRRILKQ